MEVRDLALAEKDSGRLVHPENVIGVDESGNHGDDEPFCIAAVLCPREEEVTLAEEMIEAGLDIWKQKPSATRFRESHLPEFIEEQDNISWFAVGTSNHLGVDSKATAAAIAAKYALVQPNREVSYSVGEAALIHDGHDKMYGQKQSDIRRQTAAIFDDEFRDEFGDIYLTQSPRADMTYPSVMLADVISGQICSAIRAGQALEQRFNRFKWYREGWYENYTGQADDLYYLGELEMNYEEYVWENFTAWLFGESQLDSGRSKSSMPRSRLLNRVDSTIIREHLRKVEND